MLQWCLEFGVKEITVYALSLENFKRSPAEVNDLLILFEHKLIQLLDESLVCLFFFFIAVLPESFCYKFLFKSQIFCGKIVHT